MPVPPEAIWDVLGQPASYAYWVVGSKVIRDADPEWPADGAKFHHTVGAGPFKVSDHTTVVEAQRPGLFKLRAKGRPAGTAIVTLRMTPRPQAGGTLVQMSENPDGVFAHLTLNPATHLFTLARNAESLMRLEELALLQAERSDGADDDRRSVPPRGRRA
jgi:carbon monoxide dehydrogenase subunit G